MTENAQIPTDGRQPPAPWLSQADAPTAPDWALEGPHPGPSPTPAAGAYTGVAQPSPVPPAGASANGGPADRGAAAGGGAEAAADLLKSLEASLRTLANDRPEAVIGAAFVGGVLLALIIKRLAR